MLSLGIVAKSTRFGLSLKNGSVAVVDDGKLVMSVAEERLSGVKNDSGSSLGIDIAMRDYFPGGLPDAVVISTCCENADAASLDGSYLPLLLGPMTTCSPSHHFSHALMAYHLSPFERALVLVVDAGGNTFATPTTPGAWWTAGREQLTVFLAEGRRLVPVFRAFDNPYEWGIGEIYRAFTKFLGFGSHTQSGKTMGLAAFGNGSGFKGDVLERLEDGGLRSRLEMRSPDDASQAVERFFAGLGTEMRARKSDESLTSLHCDIAAYLQTQVEQAAVHVVSALARKHAVRNVCVSGGVALNCPMNSAILATGAVDHLFVPPCPGDDGQSIGNALQPIYSSGLGERPDPAFKTAFCGPSRETTQSAVEETLRKIGVECDVAEDDLSFSQAARLISEGQILGWFQARSEIGPRALGARSLLADPRRLDTRRRLSQAIKARDPFRPYAASVLLDKAHHWFDLPAANPFMLLTGSAKKHTDLVAIAVRHPDRTCRVQTIDEHVPELSSLLKSFEAFTGLPFVVNTSLNRAGEPIVETLAQALDLLRDTAIDGFVVGRFLIQRRGRRTDRDTVRLDDIVVTRPTEPSLAVQMQYPERRTVRRDQFGLLREYCDWILTGRKKTTVRFSSESIDLPTAMTLPVVARPGGEICYSLDIERVRIVPFRNLTLRDAKNDGFTSLFTLREKLKEFYGDIRDGEPVTIYDVKVSPGFENLIGRSLFGDR